MYKMFSLPRNAGLSRAGLNVSKNCFLEKLFGVKRDIIWCKLLFLQVERWRGNFKVESFFKYNHMCLISISKFDIE